MKRRAFPSSKTARRGWFVLHPLAIAICVASGGALAGVTGLSGQNVTGSQNGNVTTLDVGVQNATATAKSVSVGVSESLLIHQLNAQSNFLLRVVGSDPTSVFGRVEANGRFYLVNPNGIVFGKTARVDVGSMVASTLDITDQDFLSGKYQFGDGLNLGGAVVNEGVINAAHGGFVVLAGHKVLNSGQVNAEGGRVGLVAADRVLVDVEGDGLLFFEVTGHDARNRLDQVGRVQADGGSVELRAEARGQFADTVLNMTGVVQARGLSSQQGRIVIDGGASGVTAVSGTLDASGLQAGQQGGNVAVLGDQVGLFGSARVDASGDAGGGHVAIGGGAQGGLVKGPERNAKATYVSADAVVDVSARTSGNAGSVVVWSNQFTRFLGHIYANGGAMGGNGGRVEVSSHDVLDFHGHVDLSAPVGLGGLMLLDPTNIILEASPHTNPGDNATGTPDVAFGGNASDTSIQISDVVGYNQLHLQAHQDITLSAPLTMNAAGKSIVLQAGRNINLHGNLTVSGNATVTLVADADDGATTSSKDGVGTIQGAGVIKAGTGLVSLTGGDAGFTVQTDVSALSVNSTSATGHVSVTNVGALDLRAGTVGGNLSVTATTGNIGNTAGTVTVQGNTTLTTSAANATINVPNLASTGTVSLNTNGAGGHATVVNATALDLAASNVGGNLSATATTGNLTNTAGAVTVTGGTTLATTANDATINVANLASTGAVGLSTNGTAGHATIVNAAGLALATSNVRGNLNATATTGNITQTGVLTVDGTATVAVGTAGGNIDLSTQANHFKGGLVLGGVLANINDLKLRNTSATAPDTSFLGATNLHDLTVIEDAKAVNLPTLSVGGNLAITAGGGDITSSGLVTVTGTTSLRTTQADANINVATLASTGAVDLHTVHTTGAGGHATVVNANGLDLAASSVGGDLNASATLGTIANTTGTVTVGGTSTLTTSAAGATINVGHLASTGAVSLNTNGAGSHATVVNATALDLAASNVGGNLNATATTGNLTNTAGTVSVQGNTTLTTSAASATISVPNLASTGTVSLNTNGAGGHATVVNATALDLATSNVGGNLNATATTGNLGNIAGTVTVAGGTTLATTAANATINVPHLASTGAISLTTHGTAGHATVVNDAGFVLGGSTVRGNLAITAAHGDIGQNAASTVLGTTTVSVGTAGSDINLGTHANNFLGGVILGGVPANIRDLALRNTSTTGPDTAFLGASNLHDLTVIEDAKAVNLPTLSIGGNLAITAGGNITSSGLITVAGRSSFTATPTNASITLNNMASTGSVDVHTTGSTGHVTLDNSGALDFAASQVGGDLSATAGGAVTQTGSLTVAGTSSVNAGANDITLTSVANDFNHISLNGGAIRVRDANDLTVNGFTSGANKTVSLVAGGSLTLPVGAVDTGSADLTLSALGGSLQTPGTLTGRHIGLTGRDGITVANSITASGTFGLGSTNSSITQTGGAITAAGLTTVVAGTGAVSLNQASNDFSTLNVTGGAITVRDTNDLSLTGLHNGADQAVSVRAGGTLALSAAAIDTGAADLTLVSNTGALNTAGNLSGHNLALGGAIGLGLGHNVMATGTLLLATANSAITQTAGTVTATGQTTVSAGTGAVTLAQAGNDLSTVTVTGGTTSLRDANNLTITALNVAANQSIQAVAGGTLTLPATAIDTGTANLVLASNGGTLATAASLSGRDLSLTGATGVTLGHAVTATNLLTLQSGGTVTQTAALSAAGLQLLGAGSFTVTNALNRIGTLAANTTGAVNVRDADGLIIGTVGGTTGVDTNGADVTLQTGGTLALNEALNVGAGRLTLNAAGAVTQASGKNLTGSGLQLLGTGAVVLTNAGNHVATLAANTTGSVSYRDANALAVGTVGATTGIASNGADVSLQSGGALTFNEGVNTGAGKLSLNAPGAITQAAGKNITAAGLALLGTGPATLTNAGNNVAVLAASTTGAVAYRDADGLAIGTVGATTGLASGHADVSLQTGGVLAINEAINAGTGRVTLNTGGAVTQAAGKNLTAAGLQLLGTGPVTLNNAGNQVATLAASTTGGVSYRNASALSVGTVGATSGVTTASSDVSLQSAGALTLDQAVNAGTANVTLNTGGPVTQAAGQNLTAGGLELLGTGPVTLANAGNSVNTMAGNTTGAVQYRNAGNLTVGTVNTTGLSTTGDLSLQSGGVLANTAGIGATNTTLHGAGGVNLGANVNAAGTLALSTTNQAINQTAGAITATGATTVAAGTGNVSLNRAGNHFGGGFSVTNAMNVAVRDALNLQLGASILSGDFAAQADGTGASAGGITQSGALNVAGRTSLTAATDKAIALMDAGNYFGQAVSLDTGSVALRADSDGLQLDAVTVAQGGSIESGGTLSLVAPSAPGRGTLTLNGGVLNLGSAGVMTLHGNVQLNVGTLTLTSRAIPVGAPTFTDEDLGAHPTLATYPLGGTNLPVYRSVRQAPATIVQDETSRIVTSTGTQLRIRAPGNTATQVGGSVYLDGLNNNIAGGLSVVSGQSGEVGSDRFNGATGPMVLSYVRVNAQQVNVVGQPGAVDTVSPPGTPAAAGIEADVIKLTTGALDTGTSGGVIRGRLPFDNVKQVTATSIPTMVLVPKLTSNPSPLLLGGPTSSEWAQINLGDGSGAFVTIRPKDAGQGVAIVYLGGPDAPKPAYDGNGKQNQIRLFYNGQAPATPQEEGALNAVTSVIEEARRGRFEEAVRTENVSSRLRTGVIAEVGAGRPATEGGESIRLPQTCSPKGNSLSCD